MRKEVVVCDRCGRRCDKTATQLVLTGKTRRDLCPLCSVDLLNWVKGGEGPAAEEVLEAEATSDLVVKIRKSHADAMMALAADVHPYSGQAVRDHEEAHEEALVALATRLRQAERERDEARRAMQYYCGRAQDAERERDDLFHAFHKARALLGSGEGQEPA